jgi:hypothetical protein
MSWCLVGAVRCSGPTVFIVFLTGFFSIAYTRSKQDSLLHSQLDSIIFLEKFCVLLGGFALDV